MNALQDQLPLSTSAGHAGSAGPDHVVDLHGSDRGADGAQLRGQAGQRGAIHIYVAGEPVAKGRPRVMKSGVAFTPAKTRRWETTCRVLAQQQMVGRELITCPVRVQVVAEFVPSASWPAWKQQAALAGMIGHTSRPDGENIAKAALDALNAIVYADDQQVVELVAIKRYARKPGVSVSVEPLDIRPSQIRRRDEF